MDEANEDQLKWINPFYQMAIEQFDAYLSIGAPTNTREGSGCDPEKRAIKQTAIQPIFDTLLKRFADGAFKWCATQFPTQAAAQDANMEFEDYEQFVFNAYLPDRENPIGFLGRYGNPSESSYRKAKGSQGDPLACIRH